MTQYQTISPWHVLLPVSLGTGLSLIGDSTLYAVLPTHTMDVGVSLASVGILLSVNRFIRVILNGPTGLAYDRWRRRPLFISALFIGACSTLIYGLMKGFWPLLMGRLLWGVAWAGIWVGGNSIIIDISQAHSRGRLVGIYQISFFLGASSGAMAGGLLTDWLGYNSAMGIGACLALLGAIHAMLFLPETSRLRKDPVKVEAFRYSEARSKTHKREELASAIALLAVNRLVLAGIFMSTFGLLLLEKVGESIQIGGLSIGVASLTGIGLGASHLVSMLSAPIMGGVSDRMENRWKAAACGLLPGVAGFVLLALGSPIPILLGLSLTAFTGGSNQGLSTAIVGDKSDKNKYGRHLGILFTSGDLAAAIGPLLAYALMPMLGIKGLYFLSGGFFGIMFWIAWKWVEKLKTPQRIKT